MKLLKMLIVLSLSALYSFSANAEVTKTKIQKSQIETKIKAPQTSKVQPPQPETKMKAQQSQTETKAKSQQNAKAQKTQTETKPKSQQNVKSQQQAEIKAKTKSQQTQQTETKTKAESQLQTENKVKEQVKPKEAVATTKETTATKIKIQQKTKEKEPVSDLQQFVDTVDLNFIGAALQEENNQQVLTFQYSLENKSNKAIKSLHWAIYYTYENQILFTQDMPLVFEDGLPGKKMISIEFSIPWQDLSPEVQTLVSNENQELSSQYQAKSIEFVDGYKIDVSSQ